MAAWSKEQIKFLEDFSGELPFNLLLKKYHEKWPNPNEKRTERAMYLKLHAMNISAAAKDGEWINTANVSRILGISNKRVYHWIKKRKDVSKCLRPIYYQRRAFAPRSRWRKVAAKFPELFGGISHEKLQDLIEDTELARQITSCYRYRMDDTRIMCLETGIVYPSCKEAAREVHVSPKTIRRYAGTSSCIPSLGLTFQYLRHPFCLV
jgi:hypothetical protein